MINIECLAVGSCVCPSERTFLPGTTCREWKNRSKTIHVAGPCGLSPLYSRGTAEVRLQRVEINPSDVAFLRENKRNNEMQHGIVNFLNLTAGTRSCSAESSEPPLRLASRWSVYLARRQVALRTKLLLPGYFAGVSHHPDSTSVVSHSFVCFTPETAVFSCFFGGRHHAACVYSALCRPLSTDVSSSLSAHESIQCLHGKHLGI